MSISGLGWHPAGDCVRYYRNGIERVSSAGQPVSGSSFYTLEWKYRFDHSEDDVFFAQFPPFTYSDLLHDLQLIQARPRSEDVVRIDRMCETLAKNVCPVLLITENATGYLPYRFEQLLAAKSTGSRNLVLNRVSKLRSRLLQRLGTEKSKASPKKKKREKDSHDGRVAEDLSLLTLLEEIVDPTFLKEHELESRCSLNSVSCTAQAPRAAPTQERSHNHRTSASRYAFH